MNTRGILVRLPGLPFTLEDLTPDSCLAKAAESLDYAGVKSTIVDYGTLETLKHAKGDGDTQPDSQESCNIFSFNDLADKSRVDAANNAPFAEYCERIASSLADPGIHFFLFNISEPKDLQPAAAIVKHIRSHCPRTRILATGKWFHTSEYNAIESLNLFDCIYLGNPTDESFLRLIDALDRPALWKNIPNILYQTNVGLCFGRIEPTELHDHCGIGYSDVIYSSLFDDTKLHIYDVDEVIMVPTGQVGNWEKYGIRPADDVVEDMINLHNDHNCQGIRLTGADSKTPHVERVAYELLKKKAQIRYCRDAHINGVLPQGLPSIHASGCRSIRFVLHSGSQRLLEDFYGESFNVSQVERMVRACKFSNIYTIADFTYPSLEDDHHTRAETVRLIDRCRPHSACFEPFVSDAGDPSRLANRSRAERQELIDELRAIDQDCQISSLTALLAERVGQKGNENEFQRSLEKALRANDVKTLRQIFQAAVHQGSNATRPLLDFRPFIVNRQVVGN